MRKILLGCILFASAALFAGAWTDDFEAAKKLSKEKNLPLMLDFTGSDWCGWCKLMDRKVFAEKTWDDWAKANLVCVTVDFPRAASKVSPKTRAQNEKLLARFGVQVFPKAVYGLESIPHRLVVSDVVWVVVIVYVFGLLAALVPAFLAALKHLP